eukprot:8447671-Pyramimonas_sp.AAC.1
MLFVHSHLEALDLLQGKAPKLLVAGNSVADAFASLAADGARVLGANRSRVHQIENKAFLVRMRILQSTIEALAIEQEHEKSLGRKAARRAQPRPPAPSICAMFSSQH